MTWNPSESTKPPEIIGGVDSLISNIHYPFIARNMGYGGSVLCEFTISSEGKVSTVKVLKSIGAGCDEICLLYTSDAADERSSVDLGGRRIIKKKKKKKKREKKKK